MNRTLLIVLGVVAVLVIFLVVSYNGTVSKEEAVSKNWGQVETAYQRRLDLIDNLVATVKGAANYESSTLEAVINARNKAPKAGIDAENLSPEAIQQYEQAQAEAAAAARMIVNVVVERYPELKATQNFLEFQSQLEGSENRINKARNDFQEAVQNYNAHIRRFPAVLYAGMFGFEKKDYYKSDSGAEKAPKVTF